MKKSWSAAVLFATRLLVYFAVFCLPLIHPGITVAYDREGIVLWFAVVPLEAFIAFWPGPFLGMRAAGRGLFVWIQKRLRVLLALAVLFLGASFGPGLNASALGGAGIGCLSFLLTLLLFKYPRWGKAAICEQIFFALVCFRMLAFSRSSEEVAAESSALTQGILIFTLAAFLLHGMVIYFCLFRREAAASKTGKKRREIAVLAGGSALAVLLLIVLLPPDFVKNSVISNLLQDRVNPRPVPIDADGDGMPDGNLRSDRRWRNRAPGSGGEGDGPRLEGIPESQWPGQGQGQGENPFGDGDGNGDSFGDEGESGKGQGAAKQYAVMVVAAKNSPVYAAGSYNGELHPVRGFLPTQDEILNKLPRERLLETWLNSSFDYDWGRMEEDVFFLSTLPEKYLPYKPLAVEPTVLQRGSGPFRYSHRVSSAISRTEPEDWMQTRELMPEEKEEYAAYLDAALAQNDIAIFDAHLRGALEAAREDGGSDDYFGRILAILKSFSAFQYNAAGMRDNTSIPAMIDFLTFTKEGDCTEFSNTAAILGRLAGIPSRVVTGYLAADGLQTNAHLRGLAVLRNHIKLLQEYPLEELFLVTNAHRHSWVQFWLPEYGWVDFEATEFAIPPVGMGDANNRDVVIPIFEEEPELTPLRSFPWKPVLRALALFAVSALAAAYALRYGREAYLSRRGRKSDVKGARAVYKLLLMKLAAEGKPLKPPAKTAGEYAAWFPQSEAFKPFAALYTELRYRAFPDEASRLAPHAMLCAEYSRVLAGQRRKGLAGLALRIFSLRGLAYL